MAAKCLADGKARGFKTNRAPYLHANTDLERWVEAEQPYLLSETHGRSVPLRELDIFLPQACSSAFACMLNALQSHCSGCADCLTGLQKPIAQRSLCSIVI